MKKAEMTIEQVIFRELPARYSEMEGKELGFARRLTKSWQKGLSGPQEKYSRSILKRLIRDEKDGTAKYCGESSDLIDDDDTEAGREVARDHEEF